MEQQRHFFFAAVIPDEMKKAMKAHCEQLKEVLPFRSWVYYEDFHITLTFLGGASSDRLQKAMDNVATAVKNFEPFPLQITNLGIFGKKDEPRVLWAGMKESSALQSIQTNVYSSCLDAGFELETRPFRPHLTIARKWIGEEPFQRQFLEKWAEIQPEPLEFNVQQIALYETHLNKLPKYEAVQMFT
ncbi:RNA 2',3'-cyclic phosphodiesterase [Neobacillus sp. SM06]|uniref:RNA 2',3'-cyclic phosphodiesterase n=1 Tax=Neobacillus sp. SM06 TaxID=3422492 RepID=UPI003D2DE875